MRRNLRKPCKIEAAVLGLLVFACTLTAFSKSESQRMVELKQAVCGALLREDFNIYKLENFDMTKWVTWPSGDPGIKVSIENGELCMKGTTTEIRPDSMQMQHNAYLMSRNFRARDVCVAVGMKMPSDIPENSVSPIVDLHLCGVNPDVYPEIAFGRIIGPECERLFKEYPGRVPGQPEMNSDLPWTSARGWMFLAIPCEEPDRIYRWMVMGDTLPEQGDEKTEFHDAMIMYDAPSGTASAYVTMGGKWVELGKSVSIIHNMTRIELKSFAFTDTTDDYLEVRFDDCRLYLNPKRHPVRFITVDSGVPHLTPPIKYVLYTQDGKTKVSEGITNKGGFAELTVDSPAWVGFPVGALVKIFDGSKEIAQSLIKAEGIEGLYPADVWVFDYNRRTVK